MEKRYAQCVYNGERTRKNECDKCKGYECCHCEEESDPSLPMFKSKPDEEVDEFYCGCQSWD